ncbi:MAG: hypothetical protein AAF560_09895 [Acidobacteriota bacterium]
MATPLSFVVCTERGHLERMSLLFARSVRELGGALASAPILSYQPRPGYGISRRTLREFERLAVDHRVLPLNTRYADYGFANKPFAAAHAEGIADSEILVFADSDQLITAEPSELLLDDGFDLGLRPVHIKDIGAESESDTHWGYWEALYETFGITELRYVTSSVDRQRVLAYWNGGLICTRRSAQFFSLWLENFHRLMASDLRPRGQLVYVEQTSLAATAVASGLPITTLPESYNYPVNFQHLMAPEHRIDRLAEMTLVHYHDIFRRPSLAHPLADVLGDDEPSRRIRAALEETGVWPDSKLGKAGHFSRWVRFKLETELRLALHRITKGSS